MTGTETAGDRVGDTERDREMVRWRHQKRLSGGQRSMGRYKTETARDK